MNKSRQNCDIFNFPCEYPLKIMGLDCPELKAEICAIIEENTKQQVQKITSKKSTKGKYISYTIRVIISSKQQINTINQELQNCKLVAYIL